MAPRYALAMIGSDLGVGCSLDLRNDGLGHEDTTE